MNQSAITAVVRQELRTARRERLPMILLAVFFVLIAAATFIGWMTHTTVTSVYNEALREGATSQPNPFLLVAPLDSVKNIVIYISLIGALLAIVMGVQSALRDRKAKVLGMVLSRPLHRRAYAAAKLSGIMLWLAGVLGVAALMTWVSVWIVRGQPVPLGQVGQLMLFFFVSWCFLLPFAAIGLWSGMSSRQETTALLLPILIWALIMFIVPQLGTAAEPISFLNPVPAQVASTGPFFSFNQHFLQPLSYIDHYKAVSSVVLQYTDASSLAVQLSEAIGLALATTAAYIFVSPRMIRSGELYE